MKTLGKKKWAIVHSTDAFGTAGGKALAAAIAKGGGTVALDQGYANQSQDFTPVVLAMKQFGRRHPRLLFHLRERSRHLCPPAAAARRDDPLCRLAVDRERRRDEARRPGALQHLWRRRLCRGFERSGSKAFGKAYRDVAKVAPDNQASWTFDAVTILAKAINDAEDHRAGKRARGDPRHQGPCRAPKASTISTPTATACTATMSCEREGHDRLRQAHRVQGLSGGDRDLRHPVDAPACHGWNARSMHRETRGILDRRGLPHSRECSEPT